MTCHRSVKIPGELVFVQKTVFNSGIYAVMRRATEAVFIAFLHKESRFAAPRSCAQDIHSLRTAYAVSLRFRRPLKRALMAAESVHSRTLRFFGVLA